MPVIGEFVTRDLTTIRDSILRVIRNGLIDRGITNPNVTPGSDWHVLATSVALQCVVVESNCAIKADAMMPDTALEEDLGRWASILGLSKQPAAGSSGPVVLTTAASTTIQTGAQLYDESGLRYEVVIGGVYLDDEYVSIRAISTGSATNHAEGDTLRWVDTPTFADEKVLVGRGGLVNGVDEEDDEALRSRVLAFLQNPPRSGNWAYAAYLAEQADSRVKKAFPYPAVQGPATYHLALVAAPTATNKSRQIDTVTVNGIINPYVIGRMPRHAYSILTTVTDVNADVAFGLSLPESPTASPPGLGGGWKDGSPWPRPDGVTSFRCTVTAVTSDLVFTVDAQTAPQVGTSHVAFLSPDSWTLYRAVVVASSGTAGAYTITLDAPFTGIAVGCYVWPDSEQAQAYVDAILASFAEMGPGEKTANASALIRGFRHPPPSVGWPYALGPTLLRALSNAGDEVADAQYLHRTDGTTTLSGGAGQVKPQVPAVVTSPPNIFCPRHLGLYRNP